MCTFTLAVNAIKVIQIGEFRTKLHAATRSGVLARRIPGSLARRSNANPSGEVDRSGWVQS